MIRCHFFRLKLETSAVISTSATAEEKKKDNPEATIIAATAIVSKEGTAISTAA